jgi:hypothetical protein
METPRQSQGGLPGYPPDHPLACASMKIATDPGKFCEFMAT